MKIIFLSHTDSNLFRFRLPIMLELTKNGHEVIALTPKGKDFDKFAPLGIRAVAYSINRGSLNPFSALKTIKELTKILKELQPDILHTFMLKPNIYGAFSAYFAKVPCVINSLTGLGSFYIENHLKAKIFRSVIEFLSFFSFKIANKVLFQNNDDLNLYVKKGLLPKHKAILIKGSGINTQDFMPFNTQKTKDLRKDFLQRINKDSNKEYTIFLMVARAILHKGVLEYFSAAKKLSQKYPNALFLYVGGVDLGNIAPIREAFLKGQESVIYLGERNDIKELLAICDVFVLPSFREGIPRTLLEAASMEKPIVTTDAVGCKEVVEHNKNGFLCKVQDVKSLQESLEKLYQNKDLQKTFGENGRKKILQEFSIESIVKEYLNLYEMAQDSTIKWGFYKDLCKPILDFTLSLFLLILFLPILCIVALLIRIKLGAPVFFTQERPGKNGAIFKIYKFRTMQDLRDKNGELLPDNVRLKGFGKAIRKTSLDELPQLFNVLKGDMSFIGPRPLLVEYLPLYSKTQAKRHRVKPGITGWAQINGRNAISWEEKFRLDVWYVEHISFLLDCKIFFLTFYKVIKRKDIHSQTSVTMEKFTGSKDKN